jgi:signal transduction histidine kinase/sensor domain CHASE-containing protein
LPVSDANRSSREWLGRNPRFRIRLIAGGVALLLLVLTLALWRFSLLFLDLPLHEAANQHTRLITERLTNYLETRLTTLKHVAQFYTLSEAMLSQRESNTDHIRRFLSEDKFNTDYSNRFLNEGDFQKFCSSAIGLVPGILAILLADTDGVPIWVAPEPASLDRKDIYWLTTDPRFTNALGVADTDSQIVITEPMNLPLHGQGLLAAVPVTFNHRHLGFIVGIIPFQEMLDYLIVPGIERDFHIRIEQGGRTIYPLPRAAADRAGAPDLWTEAGVSNRIPLGNSQWSVSVTPLRAGKHSPFNFVSLSIAGLGLCLSLIGAHLIHRVLWRAVRLQSEASDQRSRLERTGLSLMEVKSQLDLILGSVDEGIVLYDGQLAPVQANAAFLTMFQMTENNLATTDAHRHHEDMVRLLGRETRYWALFEALRRDPVRAYTDEIETPLPKDNKIQRPRGYLRRAIAVTDPHDALHGILVIYKDISTLKDIERVKDEFLSSVTHELRSPLASIKGFAEMIKRDPAMPEATREEFVSIICEESARLQHLIEELLDLRRLQAQGMPLRVVPLDLKALVDDVVRGAHSVAHAKNIRIETQWNGLDNARLRGDVAQIGRALRNLVVNAVKYSPRGGTISVRGNAGLRWISLEVSDQGTGIDEKDLPYIFDQFYRGSSRGHQKGTGLGLAIVKHTVEMHGGHLGVRTEVGHGTSFRIELPRDFQPDGPVQGGSDGAQDNAVVAARQAAPFEAPQA